MGQRSRFQQELVKLTLRLDRAAGRLVVGWGQFWRLEGEALAEEAWKALQRARGVLRLPPDLPARTLPTRLHAASFLPDDQNPCRAWPSATWQIADRTCAYQAQIADNSQIEFYGAAETLSENYRRFGPDKHICNRRFAKLSIATPTSPLSALLHAACSTQLRQTYGIRSERPKPVPGLAIGDWASRRSQTCL